MKSIILSLNTTDNKEIQVSLAKDDKEFSASEMMSRDKTQVLLPLIERLLKEHHITLLDVSEIRVHVGPGSFTGLKVGVSVANTLGTILKIPVNGGEIGELVEPQYQ